MDRIPYRGRYPSAARLLIEAGVTRAPRQYVRDLRWAEGIDIVYTLRDLTPANFAKWSDTLLLLTFQEATRYRAERRLMFARLDVRLGRLKKGRDLPEVASYQAHMHDDPDVLVYGPGYETPGEIFLVDQIQKVLDIARRYGDQLNKQAPFRVIRLTIFIRQPRRPGGTPRSS